MKARVKATGEIVNVTHIGTKYYLYDLNNVEILDEPDYWEKLHHQAVIAAMQGLMSKEILDTPDSLSLHAIHYATTLVNKLKKE